MSEMCTEWKQHIVKKHDIWHKHDILHKSPMQLKDAIVYKVGEYAVSTHSVY